MKIGVIAALPGELKPLVKGWNRLPAAKGSGVQMWETQVGVNDVVAVCAGMGAAAARRAFVAAEFTGAMDVVLSVGWVGALVEECRAGEVYEAFEVVDAQTGERFACSGGTQRLVTTVRVADAPEKQRLAASYRAAMVDMEAAAVARLAAMRGIPVRSIKAVSDGVGAELPDLNPFIDVNGQMEMMKFLGYVALRPGFWGPLAELGRNSALAAEALAVAVRGILSGSEG
jgi:adenosylhomocysteine nucleosidase